MRGELAPERRADVPVRYDVAECVEPLLGGAEPRRAEMAGVGNADLAHRAGVRLQVLPDAERLEDPPAAVAQRAGAIIEARLPGRIGDHRLDQCDAPAGSGERERQARTDHAAADDRDLDIGVRRRAHAAAISFSMTSGSVGAPALSTSWPVAVTATSSSMRMPMFQKLLGTPRVPAGM